MDIYEAKIEVDGRVAIPAKLRKMWPYQDIVIVEAHPGLPYVKIWLTSDSMENIGGQDFSHWRLSGLNYGWIGARLDESGRIHIPKRFRQSVELLAAVVFVATEQEIQLWSKERWQASSLLTTSHRGDLSSGGWFPKNPVWGKQESKVAPCLIIGGGPLGVDNTGRIRISPAIARKAIGKSIVMTRGFGKCAAMYGEGQWRFITDEVSVLPLSESKMLRIARALDASVFVTELETRGRLLVPAPLREFAGIRDRLVLASVGPYFEMWSAELWDEAKQVVGSTAYVVDKLLRDIGNRVDSGIEVEKAVQELLEQAHHEIEDGEQVLAAYTDAIRTKVEKLLKPPATTTEDTEL